MASGRQQQFPGQMRVDAPHLRALESGVAADFDVLVGQMLAGGRALVISGFELSATINAQASTASIVVGGSEIAHPLATDAGSILRVPTTRSAEVLNATTNTRVSGSWTTGLNYVGIDLRRTADATTADVVQFIDANTKLESPQSIPLAKTFDYVIYISTQDFSTTPTIAPLCKVTVSSTGQITAVEDARDLFFRLGSGGSITNTKHTYAWPAARYEAGNNSDFHTGDKVIGSLKDWCDSVMTRLWELGGGNNWYTIATDRDVLLCRTGSPFVSNGQYFEWDGTNLHWQGLQFLFSNSATSSATPYYNAVSNQTTSLAGLTDLTDGQCIYVDIDRTQAATVSALKATLATLGAPAIPGSRYVLAWRKGTQIFTRNSDFAVGSAFAAATTSALGMVQLQVAPGSASNPVVFNPDVNGSLTVTATGVNISAATLTGTGSGNGATAQAGATGIGLQGTGGATSGVGVKGIGGPNSVGVLGQGTGTGAGGSFTGGATGPGVVAQGTGSGAGVDATGGSSGIGVITHGVASSDVPQVVHKDSAGNLRHVVDHNGYPMGRASRWEQRFDANPLYPVMFTAPDTYGASTLSATYPADFGTRNGGTTASTQYSINSYQFVHLGFSGLSLVIEAEVSFSTVSATNTVLFFGITSSVGPTAGGDFFGMQRAAGGTNWQAVLAGVTPVNLNIAPAVGSDPSPQRLRVEIHGSASPYGSGGNGKVRCFVNDQLRGEISGVITSTGAGFCCGAGVTGTAASVATNTNCGPVLAIWNRVLSLPAL